MGITAVRAKNTPTSIREKEGLARRICHTEWGGSACGAEACETTGAVGQHATTAISSTSSAAWVHSTDSTPKAVDCRPSTTQETA